MGNGFNLSLIQRKGRLQKRFAVAGGAGTHDFRVFRQHLAKLLNGKHGRLDGIAPVARIEGIQKLSVCAYQCHFCRGGAGVNAEEAVARIG